MTFFSRVVLGLLAAFCGIGASAAASVTAQLRPAAAGAVITLEIANVGDAPVLVSAASLPYLNGRGMLLDDPFLLQDSLGRSAAFTGIMTDRLVTSSTDKLTLAAGATRTITVDLAKSYRVVPGGRYQVRLRSAVSYLHAGDLPGIKHPPNTVAETWLDVPVTPTFVVVPLAPRSMDRRRGSGEVAMVAHPATAVAAGNGRQPTRVSADELSRQIIALLAAERAGPGFKGVPASRWNRLSTKAMAPSPHRRGVIRAHARVAEGWGYWIESGPTQAGATWWRSISSASRQALHRPIARSRSTPLPRAWQAVVSSMPAR